MRKLAIVISHPIQYYVPLFKILAQYCDLCVYYTWGKAGIENNFDPKFQRTITWDLPMLDGYHHVFLINVARNPGSSHFNGIVTPSLPGLLTAFRPEAILVYGWAYKSHLQVLRKFKGKIPIWFRGDSTTIDGSSIFKKLARSMFLSWVYAHIDTAFYVGTANKAYYELFGLSGDRLVFAPHAVDNDRFAEDRSEESQALRSSLGISANDTVILFAGKLEPKKDPMLLLKAFSHLECPSAHLLFVGNGVLEASLKAEVLSGRHQHVHFLDFQNQTVMPVIYQACDLFCLPSKGPGETWGLAVNEAMAAGKPVLTSDHVGCTIDLVLPNITGDRFESSNMVQLVEKLKLLTLNKNKLREMGVQAKTIIQNWSFDHQADCILKMLNK